MNLTDIHKSVLDTMAEAVYVLDRDLTIRYANPASAALTGYQPDEALGRRCSAVFCSASAHCGTACRAEQAMIENKANSLSDGETLSRDGCVHQTRVSYSPFMSGDECTGAVVVISDISNLRRAEQMVADRNRFLRTVIDSLIYPFLVIDPGTYEIRLSNSAVRNPVWEGMKCHELSHLSSTRCSSADHPCPLEMVKQTGEPAVVEHLHPDADGSLRHVEVHCFPITDENGAITDVIEYSIDITDRKEGQKEMEMLVRKLQEALTKVKQLQGLIPICSSCKKIRDDKGYWNHLEAYLAEHSAAEFTHGFCPECAKSLYPDYFKKND